MMKQGRTTQPTPEDKGGSAPIWEWLTPLLAHLAQILSLAGLVGFISAIALNSLLFRLWGLSFLQLASTSDVILSGLQLAFLLLVPIGSGALGWWAVGRARQRWATEFSKGAMLLFLALTLAGWIFLNASGWISGDTTIYVAVLTLLFISLIRVSANLDDWWQASSRRGRVVVSIWVLVLVLQGVLPAIGQFSLVVREGMVGAQLVAPVISGCVRPTIMWIGERAVVVRCPTREIRVLYQAEDIQLTPVRGPIRRSTGVDDLFRELFGFPEPPWARN